MKLVLGAINGQYLRDITENNVDATDEVLAAVAYASQSALLFDWCWKNDIPLKFYGRLTDDVAVSVPILDTFLSRKSPNYTCRLVQHHHAKVIWWRGVGVYVGSANLSDSAWYKNVEAGCFFQEGEIDDQMATELTALFATLDKHATPLTDELLSKMRERAKALRFSKPDPADFWTSPSITKWPGLVHVQRKSAIERQRASFLEEWHSTLQDLRGIGARITDPSKRPSWIDASAAAGVQTDQFLHAHYYLRTFEGNRANYSALFEKNKTRREAALAEAIEWWSQLPEQPSESKMINETAPALRTALTEQSLISMSQSDFHEVCSHVHAIRDYARRVPNKTVLLPDGTPYTMDQKIDALAKFVWNGRTANGSSVSDVLKYILYGGESDRLPQRLWEATTEPNWKIDGLGISALGEIVGWAAPDKFPPRNGRTSKALKSLGFDVTVHVGG